ncbi:Helix-turn-helix [Rhodoferax sp. OV413]|uniref:helix-turn-helix domain-containing protein n=1 Tax=Rhodoferax sp. OV413 TaxID=1855285 RepID=UPI00088837E9|nr:helix-turn-helix transcriptional regulator [Rhodoferax sp. OV413]SDP92844.1 Helix-turn-helix [Rhodoferax sp. OV413]
MKSHSEVAQLLRQQMRSHGITQAELSASAGLPPRTLQLMLNGSRDYRLGTLLAVADRLGLEMVLVPKSVASAVHAGSVTEPAVKSVVQAALERATVPGVCAEEPRL